MFYQQFFKMEDVYTIKVKTKPDTRNLYPSERRYSASTVSGLAWVHIALAATSFLLACLALVNPTSDIKRLTLNDTEQTTVDKNELIFNLTEFDGEEADNGTTVAPEIDNNDSNPDDNNAILVLAATMLTVFALGAGIASIMASVRWYIDRNITWLFIMSVLSTIFALISFVMIAVWFATTQKNMSDFYKGEVPFEEFILVKHSDVVHKNDSHMLVKASTENNNGDDSHLFTKRVLSINILIAAFLELLWSILSVKISFKGMRNSDKEDDRRRGNCISIVTKIKGNTNKLARNANLMAPKPEIIDHYPSTKIKKIFLAQSDNGFYLKNQNNKAKNTETSSEFYKERMMNFLNRCASQADNEENMAQSETAASEVVHTVPEVAATTVTVETDRLTPVNRMTPVSWGDTPEHTVYNQNTLNLEKIFKFNSDDKQEKTGNVNNSDNVP